MEYQVEINIMPLKELLDTQGKAVEASLHQLDFNTLINVRIGKHINLKVDATSFEEALILVDNACKKLLHNPVMEYYEIKIVESN